MERDISTEEKIKEAARKVFHEKGYGQARTRDIAEEAGINLALLNYYFRSKEKLFDIIMEESLHEVFSLLINIANDKSTTLSEKIDAAVRRYIDSLMANPNLPLFVLSEVQANPQRLAQRAGLQRQGNVIGDSYFFRQMQEQIEAKSIVGLDPLHILMNMVSMSIFPIVGKSILINLYSPMDDNAYEKFIDERRILIPQWIKMMLKIDA